ncbi:MAG TPA: MlaD family protein [Alphaproteobacteria bacterium]|nr:MlaD family protein [Alphaproteobacteria bacterium]
METRASYVLVGAFVLLMLAGAGLFLVWLGRYQAEEAYAYYDIYFSESVSGLQKGGVVRYQGVEVGRVEEIRIDPGNIERVKVRIRVDRGTPIREGATATLELQGITGLVFVQIKGGSNQAPMFPERSEEPIPVIPSRPSLTAQILEGAPTLLAQATILIEEVREIFADENRQAFSDTLTNVRDLTGMLVGYSERIDALLASGNELTTETKSVVSEFGALATSLRGQLEGIGDDADDAVERMKQAADGFARVSTQLESLISENRRGIRDFSGSGLYEFTQLMIEARVLVESLTRVSQQLERDPARFLFGDRQKGFEIEK